MPLKLNSFSGGSVTLDPASTASDFTHTLPAVSGTVVTTGSSAVVTPAMLSQPLTRMIAQNTTSGTFVDFTGIPNWVRRITVMINGFSTNGSDRAIIQLGTSSGVTTSGYTSYSGYIEAAGQNATQHTNGLAWWHAGSNDVGILNMEILNINGNVWVASHSGGFTNGAQLFSIMGGGSVTLAGTLDRLRVTTTGGSNTLDAGTVNVMYG